VLVGDDSPAALTRLLCGRDNAARETALPRYLQYRGIAFSRHRFTRPEGRGDTFAVELGEGPRVLVLCAHHDAVPGSPGANDNAAAVGILLHLIPRLPARIPRGWRVRLLFTAAEELDYLGARAYVEDTPLSDVAGVLSPVRSSVRSLIRRPPPFHTYHTSGDALETLEPAALHRAAAALTAVVAELD